MKHDRLGQDTQGATVTIEWCLLNRLAKYSGTRSWRETFPIPAGATVRAVLAQWGLPKDAVFLCPRNGRDVAPGLAGAEINVEAVLADGDIVVFSGPVPCSFGYGAPVV